MSTVSATLISPPNTPAKISRQRITAFSAGTREFWVVDPESQTIEVSLPGSTSRICNEHESVPVEVLGGILFPVRTIFEM